MGNSHNNKITIETELSRDIGLTTALAIGIGTMIAAGIFTLSGLAVRDVGSAAIVSFLMAATVATFTALTYCEFVSMYPESGEGYLYARKTFRPSSAYFVGWALILGYTSSCAFYIASLSSYFYEFIWKTPFVSLSGIAVLVILTLINIKGTKESGNFQVVITVAKVVLLIWFVFGGLASVDPAEIIERFSTHIVGIASTAALVFITFFGFSAIAASAGEVSNPIKNIPRAIFISMGLVTLLYTLVVLVVVAAGLTDYTEAAMGEAARKYLGPIGGMVIVAGALFSMISASNASIMAGSRVTLSMSRLGHLPPGFGAINPFTRTPIVSLVLVGGTILIFVISLPLEDLAHFADTVLLLALILVNGALIVHRRKYPNIDRPFRVPLVPVLPALGILANLYLLIQILHHPKPVVMALNCMVLGVLAFLAWKGTQAQESALEGEPSRVAIERRAKEEGQFRVLVPLANPANVKQLIDLAAAVSSGRKAEIIALRVVAVPDQAPPTREDSYVEREKRILELAYSHSQNYGIPLTSLLRIAHNPARAILETARERDCDLIIMGWKGYTSTARRIFGEVVDDVVNHARSDLMLVKFVGDSPPRKILLPTAGGEHARLAEEYSSSIVREDGRSLTICSVAPVSATEDAITNANERLNQAIERVAKNGKIDIHGKLIRNNSVVVGVLRESESYDAIVVGAAGKSIYPRILFGSIPESIAKRSKKTVVMVKHYHPVKALLGRAFGE